MDPNQLQQNQPQALDPQAVMLAKAIRQTESGGNFKAKGKSGEFGAYQYTPQTWASDSQHFLGQIVPLDQASPEQQNEVAYKKIKTLKDQGYNVGQIASIWNSGNPDAFQDPNYKGTNKYGAHYDVGAYAKSVATAYHTLKGGGQVSVDPSNPSSIANPENQPTQEKGFFGNLASGHLLEAGKQAGDFLFPIVGDVYHDVKGDSQKTKLQQAADLGLSVLPFIPGLGEAGEAARGAEVVGEGANAVAKTGLLPKLLGSPITQMAGLGAGAGALGSVSKGSTNPLDVLKGAALGGITGGALGGVGQLLGRAAEYLPERITRSFLPGINKETAQYAVEKGLGSPERMFSESNTAIKKLGETLGTALKDPQYADIRVRLDDILPQVVERFPNAGLDETSLAAKLLQVAPTQKTLIEKLLTPEGLTLDELHKLNSTIGSNIYKSVLDDPTMKAGKEIANSFYHAASENITTKAPETAPLFQQLSKEYPLNTALKKAIRSAQKGRMLTLRDIVALTAGLSLGPLGGLGAVATEKALVNPTVNLRAAGLISKLGGLGSSEIAQSGGRIGALLAAREAGQIQNGR